MRMFVLALVLCPAARAQALLDYTAAAVGTSTGAAAGKKVSDGIDKALGRTGGVLGKAALEGAPSARTATKRPVVARSTPARAAAPAVPESLSRPARKQKTATSALSFVGPVLPPSAPPEPEFQPPVPPPPADPTSEQVASIGAGVTREDLLVRLGKRFSRITMVDDGRLSETYRFSIREGGFARVRLIDGAVVSVDSPGSN